MSKRSRSIHRQDRRQFLKWLAGTGLAVSGGISGSLISSLLSGKRANAAQTSTSSPLKSLVNLHLAGAPPHWLFISSLKGSATDPFNGQNKMTATRIAGFDPATREPILEHAWKLHGPAGMNWPHLWGQTMYVDASGPAEPITKLHDHWMTIRTGGSETDGHLLNSLYAETGGHAGPTLKGKLADSSDRPIPAFHMDGGYSPATQHFKSGLGRQSAPISPYADNPASQLLEAFQHGDRHPLRSKSTVWSAIREALATFQGPEGHDRPALKALFSAQAGAERLIQEQASNYSSEYTGLLAKYDAIIKRNLRSRDLEGVTDRPIPGLQLPLTLPAQNEGAPLHPTIASRHWLNFIVGVNVPDLRVMLDALDIPGLAAEFAVAEMAIKRRLSAVIAINPKPVMTIHLPGLVLPTDLVATANPDGSTRIELASGSAPSVVEGIELLLDAHGIGCLFTLVFYSVFYRALAGVLYELIRSIRNVDGEDLFQETLIQVFTEFNRSPDSTLMGSDHDFYGGVRVLLSGRITGPQLIGDIRYAPHPQTVQDRYTGTTGQGAKMGFLVGQPIKAGNVIASLARLFGVENPANNSAPVLRIAQSGPNKGKIVPLVGQGRTVMEE